MPLTSPASRIFLSVSVSLVRIHLSQHLLITMSFISVLCLSLRVSCPRYFRCTIYLILIPHPGNWNISDARVLYLQDNIEVSCLKINQLWLMRKHIALFGYLKVHGERKWKWQEKGKINTGLSANMDIQMRTEFEHTHTDVWILIYIVN